MLEGLLKIIEEDGLSHILLYYLTTFQDFRRPLNNKLTFKYIQLQRKFRFTL